MLIFGQLFSNFSVLFSVLVIASVAGLYSERAGVINISIDGLMTIGALFYSLLGNFFYNNNYLINNWIQIFSLIVSCILGAIFSLLHAFASITLRAQQVISGTALNFLASGLGLFFVSIPSIAPGNMINTNFYIISIDNFNIFNIFLIISIFLIIFTFIFFHFTKYGIRFISVGENPNAANSVGINVIKIRYFAVIISGFLSSLSGCVFTHFMSNQFRGDTQGQGYIALAIMILGQWRIQFISICSIIFSFLISLSNIMWRIFDWNISSSISQLFKIIPFILSLFIMILFSKFSKSPKFLGIPFDKSFR